MSNILFTVACRKKLLIIVPVFFKFQNRDIFRKYEVIIFNASIKQGLHEKPYFLFPNVPKRRSFRKIALEYDLSCIIRKSDIFQNLDILRKYEAITFDANVNKAYFPFPNVP